MQKPSGISRELMRQLTTYHSTEFSLKELIYAYQFKLWNMDDNFTHIIIREGSPILNCLTVGKRFNAKYYSDGLPKAINTFETEISSIDRADEGKFKGHYIIGLAISDESSVMH